MGSNQMNVQAARTNISHFPGFATVEEPRDDRPSFWVRRARDLQIITMPSAPPTKYWNTTMVTAWVAVIVGMITVLSAVVGLWYFTDQNAEKRGFERGKIETERKALEEKMASEKADQQKKIDDLNRELRLVNEKLKQAGVQ